MPGEVRKDFTLPAVTSSSLLLVTSSTPFSVSEAGGVRGNKYFIKAEDRDFYHLVSLQNQPVTVPVPVGTVNDRDASHSGPYGHISMAER